jgi:hypothetical protein
MFDGSSPETAALIIRYKFQPYHLVAAGHSAMTSVSTSGIPRVTYCFSKSFGLISAMLFFSAWTALPNAGTPVASVYG